MFNDGLHRATLAYMTLQATSNGGNQIVQEQQVLDLHCTNGDHSSQSFSPCLEYEAHRGDSELYSRGASLAALEISVRVRFCGGSLVRNW